MKTNAYDYIFSSMLISLIAAFSFFFSCLIYNLFLLPNPFSAIFSIFFFIVLFGFTTAYVLSIVRNIFPFVAGSYSMDHRQFFLWKLHSVLTQLAMPCVKLVVPIFLRPILYKIFGAKIGKQVAIGGKILDPFFVTMEEFSIIGEDAVVTSHIMTQDKFILGRITLKKSCTVGVKSIIMPGVTIGEKAIILPGSLIEIKKNIPPYEIWGGNPAQKIKNIPNQK